MKLSFLIFLNLFSYIVAFVKDSETKINKEYGKDLSIFSEKIFKLDKSGSKLVCNVIFYDHQIKPYLFTFELHCDDNVCKLFELLVQPLSKVLSKNISVNYLKLFDNGKYRYNGTDAELYYSDGLSYSASSNVSINDLKCFPHYKHFIVEVSKI
jgi:hypothetical protein